MLPAAHRLTDAASFREATRRGRRASSRTLVTHLLGDEQRTGTLAGPRVGLVVGKTVGNSVIRHRVQRRLRHAVRDHLAALPGGGVLVVRALPPAATASYAVLAEDLATCLARSGVPA